MNTGTMPYHGTVGRAAFLLGALVLATVGVGCSQQMPDRAERMPRGYIYYLDGAGGGGVVNWAGGVRRGLLGAGYNGAGEVFKWNTGLGVVPDQEASVEYKRSKAAECAQSIQQYAKDHPGAPVTLMGLSAGTAVTVFTLEALPPTCPVENALRPSSRAFQRKALPSIFVRLAGGSRLWSKWNRRVRSQSERTVSGT